MQLAFMQAMVQATVLKKQAWQSVGNTAKMRGKKGDGEVQPSDGQLMAASGQGVVKPMDDGG